MITLADYPLVMPDTDGQFTDWQEKFQASACYNLFAEPAAAKSYRYQSRYPSAVGVGLPIPNYPPPPAPRINTIYWPTGATRWARGYFLATGEIMKKIVKATVDFSEPVILKIPCVGEAKKPEDEEEENKPKEPAPNKLPEGDKKKPKPQDFDKSTSSYGVLQLKVHVLRPRPITHTPSVETNKKEKREKGDKSGKKKTENTVKDENQLWLIPVVDARYFWSMDDAGNIDETTLPAWTWKDLYNTVMAQMGVAALNLQDKFVPDYEFDIPDKIEFTRRSDNGAVLLDAMVLSCCQRMVANFDGTYLPQKPEKAKEIFEERLFSTDPKTGKKTKKPIPCVAGGEAFDSATDLPKNLVVVFKKFKWGVPADNLDIHVKSFQFEKAKNKKGPTLAIHTSMFADYSGSDVSPRNATKVNNLAEKIKKCHELWYRAYDVTLAGVSRDVLPCGFDDSIYITFGAQRKRRKGDPTEEANYEYEAHTRIRSLPLNFGVEQNCSQDSELRILGLFQEAKPLADIPAGETGKVAFMDKNGVPYLDKYDNPEEYDLYNEWGPHLKAGQNVDRCYASFQREETRWKMDKPKTIIRRGKTTGGAIAKGEAGDVQVYENGFTVSGYTIECVSPLGSVENDKWVYYTWIADAMRYEIISAECEEGV